MNGNGYTDTGKTLKLLRAIAIRSAAQKMVAPATCNDFHIIFCGAATGRVKTSADTLENLSDRDLMNLYDWIVTGPRFDRYA